MKKENQKETTVEAKIEKHFTKLNINRPVFKAFK